MHHLIIISSVIVINYEIWLYQLLFEVELNKIIIIKKKIKKKKKKEIKK